MPRSLFVIEYKMDDPQFPGVHVDVSYDKDCATRQIERMHPDAAKSFHIVEYREVESA